MRILQMIYSLSSGGAERFTIDLSNQLQKMGHTVCLCMLRGEDRQEDTFNKQFLSEAVVFYSSNLSKGFSLSKVRTVERFIKFWKPDVVHCHLNVIPYIYRLAVFDKGIKFFHTLHNVASNTGGGRMQYPLNRFFYKHNLISPVCISRLCQESYESYYKLHNAPCVDNGRSFVGTSHLYEMVRQEVETYKLSAETLVFVHVARFHVQKNQQLLIDSFNRLALEGVDFILLIIGNGYGCEEGLKLQQSACSAIHFLGEKNNVNDYLYCANAFCLTSIYEGLPISLLEALSCGVVPICTPVGGVPDVISDGTNGYLSSGQDVDSYCEAINRFIQQPIPKQVLVDYYQANYSMEVCAKKYEALYNCSPL